MVAGFNKYEEIVRRRVPDASKIRCLQALATKANQLIDTKTVPGCTRHDPRHHLSPVPWPWQPQATPPPPLSGQADLREAGAVGGA